ncbi:MAG: polymer-forming cytoskeletal protein [Patescibacteria group bacterium]
MKKFLFIVLTLVFSLSTTQPVFAQENNIVVASQTVIQGDYFAAGENVRVLGTITGDAYVAGGNVTFEGIVTGDIIATGGNVIIQGQAQNVRVFGGEITINGSVERNITAFGGNVMVSKDAVIGGSIVAGGGSVIVAAPISKGATFTGGNVILEQAINGNVYAAVGQLTLMPQAHIEGNLTYLSDEPAQLFPGATIMGKLTHTFPPVEERQSNFIDSWLLFKLPEFISLLIIGLLLVGLTPYFLQRVSDNIAKQPWKNLGIGLLTLLLGPVIFMLLLFTLIGIPAAFLFIILFVIVAYLAKLFTIYLIGEKIGKTIDKKLPSAILFLLGLLMYTVFTFIPFLGGIIGLLATLFGLGSLLREKRRLYRTLRKQKEL